MLHAALRGFAHVLVTLACWQIAYACPDDQYEQCVLGACVCLPKIGGTIGQVGENTKRETNRFVGNLARELGKTPAAIEECMRNVSRCANEIVSAPLALPAQAYIDGLYRQSEGRTRPFSPEFIALAQRYYDFDLRSVTYADDIDTGTGVSLAFCDRVFFNGHGNLWQDKAELHHTLHELEHLGQCQKRGKRTFLAEYILKVGVDIARTGRVNVHDIHDFERAADAKANNITNVIWAQMHGSSPQPGFTPQPTGFPPGYGMQVCGCWGPNPALTAPDMRCASGRVRVNVCPGRWCGPGYPVYAYICL